VDKKNIRTITTKSGIMEHFVSAKVVFVSKRYDIANACIMPPLIRRNILLKLQAVAEQGGVRASAPGHRSLGRINTLYTGI